MDGLKSVLLPEVWETHMKNAEGLLLHPSLQRKLSQKAVLIDPFNPPIFRTEVIRLDVAQKAVREVVSQIQDRIDDAKDYRELQRASKNWQNYQYWRGYQKAKEEDKALLEGSSGSKCPKGYASDKEDCRRISQRECDSCEMPKLEGSEGK